MAFTNNVMIVRHKLLAKLVNLWKEIYQLSQQACGAPSLVKAILRYLRIRVTKIRLVSILKRALIFVLFLNYLTLNHSLIQLHVLY